jgi:hypothetical protein
MAGLIQSLQQRFTDRQLSTLLRPIIIIAVLAASYYFGPRANTQLIMLIAAAFAIIIFMRWPITALFALVISAFFIKYELGTGTQTGINPAMLLMTLLLGLWAAEMLINQRRVWLYSSRVIPPVIVFSVIAILAFLTGQLPWFAFAQQVSIRAQFGGLMIFLLSMGAFLWISHQVNDLKWLRWLVWIYLGIGAVFVTVRLFGLGLDILTLERILSRIFTGSSSGSLFWVWVTALSASQAFFNSSLKLRWRILIGTVTLVTLMAGWVNRQWASGWVPSIIALLVVIFFINWRLSFFVAALLGIIFIYFDPTGAFQAAFAEDQYSFITRQEAWTIVLQNIVRVNPVLGLGPANYYNYTPLFPILGYAVRFNSHNQYVDLIAQTGILGMAIFTWLVVEIGWLGWRLKDRAPAGFPKAYVIGVMAGLVGSLAAGMLGDWIIPFVYNIGLDGFRTSVFAWLFLGGLVLIERLVNQDNTLKT